MAGFWAGVPTDRVVHLRGAAPDAVELALDALPDGAPATVVYFPAIPRAVPDAVEAFLAELDGLALRLFPLWLPEADGIEGPGGAGRAAVRAMAAWRAPAVGGFSPFLADLAERALSGDRRGAYRFAAEVRAAGLVRVIADSYRRERVAVVVHPPDDLPPAAAETLVAAGEWLAHHGNAGVWLVGPQWTVVGRVLPVRVRLPRDVDPEVRPAPRPEPPTIVYPAIRGRPRPDSVVEQALEAALARRPWAYGRAWNERYQPDPLTNPIRVDLMWSEERCVVELDGPEHRDLFRFDADRRRDVRLQLDGYAVLRFTNEQIISELDIVLSQLERFITTRRNVTLGR